MIDLTPIFEAILALLATLVTYKLIPWIKARTTAEQQSLLAATVKTLVYAAEQLYGAGKGDAKLSYVQDELESRGLKVDAAAIEAMVREMNLMGNWEAEFEVLDEAEDAEAGHDGEA